MNNAAAVVVTVKSGTSLSEPVNLGGRRVVSIVCPAGLDAVRLRLKASIEKDGTFFPVYSDGGTELVLTVAASRVVNVAEASIGGLGWVQIETCSAVPAAQNETGDAALVLLCKY